MVDIRSRIVDLARSYAGVSVSTDRYRYLDLVGPKAIEGSNREAYFSDKATSGCALVARGILREAGIRNEGAASVLYRPYRIGHAVIDVVNIGRAVPGGWVAAFQAKGRLPQPGDLLLVGPPEHVAVLTEQLAEDSWESVDGGQLDDRGQQSIQLKHRKWVRTGGNILDVTEGLYGPRTRPVMGWVDVSKLAFD